MSDRKYKNPQVNLRLPEDLKKRINELAEANGRSANAEMVAAIESWANKHKDIEVIDLVTLSKRIADLEKEVQSIKEGSSEK
ncbi:Arc family DNA-binding protein [Erwinia tracheiphila]|uniref:Arc family DNA-binding protein n=1 Tax=Erwinia tracheiphila TaxID=65700 RepID=A0A345CZ77_9GAMM|nr:Arc family DNA-binding protein [Erwinia tracheiphila]AXF78744.1 Arc family DNA-binding protein [Erwinia tracheiphila]UIA85299.1 Arc family DNA-binding protein [Erwinia tracheiphila]